MKKLILKSIIFGHDALLINKIDKERIDISLTGPLSEGTLNLIIGKKGIKRLINWFKKLEKELEK